MLSNSGDSCGLSMPDPLACLADASERNWVLLGSGELEGGSCFIAEAPEGGETRLVGYYDGATGDVFDCSDAGELSLPPSGGFDASIVSGLFAGREPAVHVIGPVDGPTGQVTVRQAEGNYLRICRWDRMSPDIAALQGGELRTLPQCGCGGSLGAPKLFSSFAEMSAYHFCAFYLGT